LLAHLLLIYSLLPEAAAVVVLQPVLLEAAVEVPVVIVQALHSLLLLGLLTL
jgi:hypothetical protein